MGKAGGVPPFLQPHLYFRSVAVWEVFSLIPPPPCSLSALKVETSVPRYISPSLPIYPSPSRATSPGGLSSPVNFTEIRCSEYTEWVQNADTRLTLVLTPD